MKQIIIASVLAAITGLSFAQMRFIEAPYPGQLPRPAPVPIAASAPQSAALVQALPPPMEQMQAGFEVTASDVNLRRALVRWTKLVGWTFEPEHWTLDRDIPVAGSASLGSDFKLAARALLSSTEMTDLPAQPCFYSNKVLRVIPLNELCSRQQITQSK